MAFYQSQNFESLVDGLFTLFYLFWYFIIFQSIYEVSIFLFILYSQIITISFFLLNWDTFSTAFHMMLTKLLNNHDPN